MDRASLLDMLARYAAHRPEEAAMVGRIRSLVASHPDCLARTCLPGHLTASSFILSADRERCLLTRHRKLGRWLQLGGHADGDADLLRVALREAREESGMRDFSLVDPLGAAGGADAEAPLPIDVDVHGIPARRDEPAHEHHDVRFLLVAGPGQPLVMSEESSDLGWFPLDALGSVGADESLLRLGRKAIALREAPARGLDR
jgi:8-oxo-dGTP pyrophosphatase MutT (NUDIX family)